MAMEPFATVDLWERLKSFLLEADPTAAQSIEDRREADWRVLTTSEAQVLAIMAALGMDLRSPADRRRARRLLGTLAAEAEGELLVAEEEDSPVVQPREVERLRKSLRWIAGNPPNRFLANAAGPQAAIREIRKGAPSLGSLAAYHWLVALGYPCAIPDPARRRWVERFGLLEPQARGQSPGVMQSKTVGVMEQLAQSVHAPLPEVDVILGFFTSGTGYQGASTMVALCGRKPRCSECPLKEDCAYGRRHKDKDPNTSRHLSQVMRAETMPRERLLQSGAGALTEEELLAILLRTGGGGLNAVDVAHKMMGEAKTLKRLAAMSISELAAIKGVGQVKAITIQAALELARRVKETELPARPFVTHSRQIFEIVEGHFVGLNREEFVVLLLDVKMRLIRTVPISVGTLTQSMVHPREAFSEAIRESAHAVVFVHNHPTGDPTPSTADEIITSRLVDVGKLMGIPVKDHVIVGRGRYYSFYDQGKIQK